MFSVLRSRIGLHPLFFWGSRKHLEHNPFPTKFSETGLITSSVRRDCTLLPQETLVRGVPEEGSGGWGYKGESELKWMK